MQYPSPPDHTAASWLDVLLLALLLAATSWLSLTLTRVPSGVASVWVSNGLLVGWLLSRPTPLWPRYVLAALLGDLLARELAGDTLPHALAFTLFNMLEALLVAGIVRRRVPNIGEPQGWLRLAASPR